MASTSNGNIPLFRLFGIQVYLHLTWIFVAIYSIKTQARQYSHIGWNIAEYLSLFGIVLMHEFGHALACRSVGGKADRIVLWPFGGIAFVQPPPRPGAWLWSIAAGPLVNVLLAPITIGVFYYLKHSGIIVPHTDLYTYLRVLWIMNIGLLVFNMLPIYPLDGGQIFQSLLWFVIGRANSLIVAGSIGIAGAIGIGLLAAMYLEDWWLVILAALGVMQAWRGIQFGRAIRQQEKIPRNANLHCPACSASPPAAPIWRCVCGQALDIFQTNGVCPACGTAVQLVRCVDCGQPSPIAAWYPAIPASITASTAIAAPPYTSPG